MKCQFGLDDSREITQISITKNANKFGVRSEIVVTRKVRFWIILSERMELLVSRSKKAITEKEAFVLISRKELRRSPVQRCQRFPPHSVLPAFSTFSLKICVVSPVLSLKKLAKVLPANDC